MFNLLKLSKVKRTKKVLEQKYLEANENEQSLSTVNTMTEFDMKTASSLLPVMTGEEECTKKLIDALEFYSQNIKKEHESLLISFVLKTRISRHAKLRLASNYDTSADLIKDMKNNLLTKQSATALQLELLQSRQGSQSIEEFGKKLEDLFVELTISQADGKEDAYKMFRPVNEKLAIQRFTEGLRNGRLSTILTARDYSELKDVIRAAKDEERAHQGHSTSAETVFAAQHRGRHRNRLRGIRYLLGLITEGAQEVLLTIREDVDYHQGVKNFSKFIVLRVRLALYFRENYATVYLLLERACDVVERH
ncbi:hypothetical protein HW555_013449 [Spodoptera exigua]|uniref:Uncharacterized protein n=1 Tax=Spodoptera exigua TaxID=7107 RepID=A0A835G3E4_SPOEX|nr:hypothetical protein HW555_013449 [Spodoptera exigua]